MIDRMVFRPLLQAPLALRRLVWAGIAIATLDQLTPPTFAWSAPPVITVDAELRAGGRNYDDACFWRHPTDPDGSLVFVTSKDGDVVEAFELVTGRFLGNITGFGLPNNCDVIGNLLITTDQTNERIFVHSIPDLQRVTMLDVTYQPLGVTTLMEDGRPLAFISDKANDIRAYELPSLNFVRHLPTALSPQEALGADELYERIFVTRDEGADGTTHAISTTGEFIAEFGREIISTDGEGIAVYRCGTQGWILVSDQQLNRPRTEFEIFDRVTFAHVGTFTLATTTGDDTTDTDGIHQFQTPTSRFPSGVFAACDKCSGTGNEMDLVSWDRIASTFGLAVCPEGRPPQCGDGDVDLPEEDCDGASDAACPGRCAHDCTCAPTPRSCGDGIVNNPAEECDGTDAAACPGACRDNCTCGDPSSTTTTTTGGMPSTTTSTLPSVEEVFPLHPIPVSQTTGEKPQSKLWRHRGTWWAVLPSTSVSPTGTWIWRLEPDHTWTNVLRLASTTASKADVKVVGDVVHILLDYRDPKLVSVQYSEAEDSYVPWSARPTATSVALPDSETATIDIDSTGRMWLATERVSTVVVHYSDPPYRSFSSPITLASGIHTDDITAVVALPDATVGVLWSNHNTKRFGFRTHRDGTGPGASFWSADEVPNNDTALSLGKGFADDHMNFAVASDGTLYAAVKTSYNTLGFTQIGLLVRRPDGTWDDLYEIDQLGTRVIVLLNERTQTLRVVYTEANEGGNIFTRTSSLSPIEFSPPELLIAGFLDNSTSTKAVWDSDLVVLAHGQGRAHGVLFTFADGTTSTTTSSTSTTSTSTTSPSTSSSAPTSTSSSTSSSSTTTTLPRPPGGIVEMSPMADTYVEAGGEATWSHGGSNHLDVDTDPWGIIYMKFDLTALPATVRSAKLRLYCTSAAIDGGTIYPVADSSWVEGTARGVDADAAGRPGLKWNDVDVNRDGTVTAADASPFVPNFAAPLVSLGVVAVGNTVEVDVTSAFGAGPRVYSFAIRNNHPNGATYSSREHTTVLQRPRLVLTLD